MSAVTLSSLLGLACSCLLKFSLSSQATFSTSAYALLRMCIACVLTSPCKLPAKSLCWLETSGILRPCPSSASTPPWKSCSFSMCSWPLWYWNFPYGGVHFINLPPLLLGLNSFLRFRFNKILLQTAWFQYRSMAKDGILEFQILADCKNFCHRKIMIPKSLLSKIALLFTSSISYS